MTRLLALTLVGAVVTAAPTLPPQTAAVQPPFQNAKVETRQATSIDRELASVGAGDEPAWIGWRVPMVDGDRQLCSFWSTNDTSYRGMVMESTGDKPPAQQQPTGPARLEGGTGLVVFVRKVNGQVERLRSISDDCPVDGGGRTVYWLNGITPAESLRYLQTFTQVDGLNIDARRTLAGNALSAIAHHRDPGADAILDRLADGTSTLRSSAISRLANERGAHGFDKLKTMLAAERDPSARQSLVSALGSTRQPGTADLLLTLARTDTDPKIRASAVTGYARAAGPAGISNVVAIIENDRDDTVKTRAVSGLTNLPGGAGIDPLLKVARSSKNIAVTKAAVSALSNSKDPRAIAYMEELVRR